MNVMPAIRTLFTLIFVALLSSSVGAAPQPDDRVALQGVKEGKGIFMISLDNPKKLALYLTVINGTHENFKRQGVAPELKIVFIGASVKYLTAAAAVGGNESDKATHGEIARQIDLLAAKGIRLEICAIATQLFGIDNATLLKPLAVINDGFISAIGYQSQGYQLVPIY